MHFWAIKLHSMKSFSFMNMQKFLVINAFFFFSTFWDAPNNIKYLNIYYTCTQITCCCHHDTNQEIYFEQKAGLARKLQWINNNKFNFLQKSTKLIVDYKILNWDSYSNIYKVCLSAWPRKIYNTETLDEDRPAVPNFYWYVIHF